MKKYMALFSGFFGLYLVFVIVSFPVGAILNWVTLPSNVELGTAKGTVWQSEISAIRIDDVTLSNVETRLSLVSLITLDPEVLVSFGSGNNNNPSGDGEISGLFSTLRLQNVSAQVSADTISQAINKPIPMTAHGMVDLNISEFVVGKALCQTLTGSISWPNASVTALEESVELGSLDASLTCEQGDVVATINDENSLGLSFTASVGNNFHVSGDGYLTPTNDMPPAIRQVLPFLGQPDNQGRYRLRF